ncbi:MAG: hypothetical protein IH991_02850, partial [Planctomycetes bacterium]|nr:hypothetical protein [Planctomycetota bacterium]
MVIGEATSVVGVLDEKEGAPIVNSAEASAIVTPSEGQREHRVDTERTEIAGETGARLELKFARRSFVFDPGERFEISVVPHFANVEPRTMLGCRAQLIEVKSGDNVWTEDRQARVGSDGNMPEFREFSVRFPNVEGVYELRLVVEGWRVLALSSDRRVLLEHTTQMIVVDSKPEETSFDERLFAAHLGKSLDLGELARRFGLPRLSDDSLDHLARMWHELPAWP